VRIRASPLGQFWIFPIPSFPSLHLQSRHDGRNAGQQSKRCCWMDGMKATGLRHVHLAANALLRAQLLTNKPGKGAWPVSTVPEHSARSITSFMPGEHGFLLMLARSAEFNPCIWFRALTHKKRYIDDEVDPIKHSLHRRGRS